MHQEHVVPLSGPALAILDKMREATQGELIFPNPDNGIFSEDAKFAALDRLGYGHVAGNSSRSGRALMKDWTRFLAGSNVIRFREIG